MHWSRDYLGVPHQPGGRTRKACDCWGLLRLVYADRLGIDLPSYAGHASDAAERDEVASIIASGRSPFWAPVQLGDEQEFDVAWFDGALSGEPLHVGVVLRPGTMLHSSREARVACPEDYRAGRWPRLLVGFYRHVQMIERSNAA